MRALRNLGASGAVALLTVAVATSACATTPTLTSKQLVSRAIAKLDATSTLHFVLDGSNLPKKGSVLISGEGDLARPDSIKGNFQVLFNGLPVAASVIGIGTKFYALLPFASHYTAVSPSELGFGDPAGLLDPKTGIAGIVAAAADVSAIKEIRNHGQVIDQVTMTLPGPPVAKLLTSAAPSEPYSATLQVNPTNYQIVQVALTGHFYSKTTDSTYTVSLSNYGEAVTIAPPAP